MQDCSTYEGTKVNSGVPRGRVKVFGVATNDSTHNVTYVNEEGKRVICPFYTRWKNMLSRVYYPKTQVLQPTYVGAVVHDDWLKFSGFYSWMSNQDWEGKELDKDLLGDGKEYSSETCCFISCKTNNFLRTKKRSNNLPVGVVVSGKKFRASIADIDGGATRCLGSYKTATEAHLAWLNRKHEYALVLAREESDPRVKMALQNRYKEPLWNGS